jgi:hypothetical protein
MTAVSLAALLVLRGGSGMRPLWRAVAALAFLLPLIAVPLNNAGVPLAPLLVGFLLFRLLRPAEKEAAIPPPG